MAPVPSRLAGDLRSARPADFSHSRATSAISSQTRFAFLPEIALKVGYQATSRLRIHAGCHFLYWSNVVCPGNVIDTGVNPSQLPPGPLVGPARPVPRLDGTDFWAHGLTSARSTTFDNTRCAATHEGHIPANQLKPRSFQKPPG